jgi:hypothetical protein
VRRGWVIGLLVATTLVVAAAVGLVAVVLSANRATAIVDLEVGDCFDLPDLGAPAGTAATEVVDTVRVVSCARPHEAEVIDVGRLNPDRDRPYPADPDLFGEVDDRCRASGDGLSERFGVVPVAPTEASWNELAGPYQCVAVAVGGNAVRGSLTDG